MTVGRTRCARAFVAFGCVAALAASTAAAQVMDARRGEYLARAGGCASCHTDNSADAVPFAGGAGIETPFGTFYGPNITPHREAGIGRWTRRDFLRAMREGVRPDGEHYYPAFPYTAYTLILDRDLSDLWAYLKSLPPSNRRNRPHTLGIAFSRRFTVAAWKRLYFSPGRFVRDPRTSGAVNRGAYLVTALGHCDSCHTPRTYLGGPRNDRHLAGVRKADGQSASNLTPTGLKKYSDAELLELLTSGVRPDGDVLAGEMDLVIRNSTSRLTRADLAAVLAYLRALPPLPDE